MPSSSFPSEKALWRPQHLHHVMVIVPVDDVYRRQDLSPDRRGGQREGCLGLEEVGHEEHLGHESEIQISKCLVWPRNRQQTQTVGKEGPESQLSNWGRRHREVIQQSLCSQETEAMTSLGCDQANPTFIDFLVSALNLQLNISDFSRPMRHGR